MQISQEAGQVVLYSHLLNNFPQLVVIYTVLEAHLPTVISGHDEGEKMYSKVIKSLPSWARQDLVLGTC